MIKITEIFERWWEQSRAKVGGIKGKISNIRIFYRSLSVEEVIQIYNEEVLDE